MPFLLDLWVTVLAQFGQREDLLKIDMAHISRSGWVHYYTPKLATIAPPKSSPKSMPTDLNLNRPEWRAGCWMTIP